MKTISILVLLFFTAFAKANTCTFKGTTLVAETMKIEIEECWDISSWDKKKAKDYCQEQAKDETSVKVSYCEGGCKCRAGSTGTCAFKVPAGTSSGLPEDYFTKNNISPEMRKQIEANMANLKKQTTSPYAGLAVILHYYSGKGTNVQIQQEDCKNKKGIYKRL